MIFANESLISLGQLIFICPNAQIGFVNFRQMNHGSIIESLNNDFNNQPQNEDCTLELLLKVCPNLIKKPSNQENQENQENQVLKKDFDEDIKSVAIIGGISEGANIYRNGIIEYLLPSLWYNPSSWYTRNDNIDFTIAFSNIELLPISNISRTMINWIVCNTISLVVANNGRKLIQSSGGLCYVFNMEYVYELLCNLCGEMREIEKNSFISIIRSLMFKINVNVVLGNYIFRQNHEDLFRIKID